MYGAERARLHVIVRVSEAAVRGEEDVYEYLAIDFRRASIYRFGR